MNPFELQRLGVIMEPENGNEWETEGVLNPAVVRGADGELYLFPRLVARGNYSRIGIARVKFNTTGDPVGVERMGIALEPEVAYELHAGGGGCEDPRITYIEPLEHYLMAYTAFSSVGPRIALAQSKDLFNWERLGLASFSPHGDIDFDQVNNKDAAFFPVAIPSPHHHTSLAMLNRPLFPGTRPEEKMHRSRQHTIDISHESIWISYCNLHSEKNTDYRNALFTSHHRLASPVEDWEQLKIGAGTPPVKTKHGWMIIYHGVHQLKDSNVEWSKLSYSAGVMILSEEHPHKIIYRSKKPILVPELPQEKIGRIANVVFPTGSDRRDDIGMPDRIDVYYGMADNCIGVAKMEIPDILPTGSPADKPINGKNE